MRSILTAFFSILFINGFAQDLQTVTNQGTSTNREIQFRSLANPNKYAFAGGNPGYARIGAYDITTGFDNLIIEAANIGMGTNNPIGKLDVRGAAFIGTSDLLLGSNGSFIQIDQGNVSGNTYSQLRAFSNGGALTNNLILQNSGGRVGIGTTNPSDMLTVAGKIGAREIKVSTNAGADFVFEPGYEIPDLKALEKFVKTHKHLPEIPTAKEMVENGVNLGELNIKLLQKVEELTLYLIEKDKKIDTLIKRVEALEDKRR
ncbi:hypothetical protein ACUN24_13520 [Pedobacter sp. WC2501]|uniref:hypothetical protein n=1 Tax=Pedobacter sp. WC2501 TaxID=3461400 RepID=UPI004045FB5C